jgi:CO/xanthine dehydrogenase FAD-binding subunit
MTEAPLAQLLPALAQAARTVGSPQIRNVGTLGGNLATASPAGDTLPVLLALDAEVVVASASGSRVLPVRELLLGPKRSALAPGELLVAARLPAGFGHQEFVKVGTRNAMVIATASVALVVSWEPLDVRVALGSVGPTPLRVRAAEDFACERLDPATGELRGARADLSRFAELVRAGARPIDDHRSSARYRRHAVGVGAARALERAMLARRGSLGADAECVRAELASTAERSAPSEGASCATN